MPEKYLPKKKRKLLESSGKKKLPAVGTSDDWLNIQLSKEADKKRKEEKAAAKKKLQEEKKILAEKRKNFRRK